MDASVELSEVVAIHSTKTAEEGASVMQNTWGKTTTTTKVLHSPLYSDAKMYNISYIY